MSKTGWTYICRYIVFFNPKEEGSSLKALGKLLYEAAGQFYLDSARRQLSLLTERRGITPERSARINFKVWSEANYRHREQRRVHIKPYHYIKIMLLIMWWTVVQDKLAQQIMTTLSICNLSSACYGLDCHIGLFFFLYFRMGSPSISTSCGLLHIATCQLRPRDDIAVRKNDISWQLWNASIVIFTLRFSYFKGASKLLRWTEDQIGLVCSWTQKVCVFHNWSWLVNKR